MTLDTTDLRAVLGERAATVTHVPDFAAEAAHLGRRTQRRRVVSSLAGAAVVVAGILGITQLAGNPHRAVLPASNFGLETYSDGMKLVVAREGGSSLDFQVRLPETADRTPASVGVSLSCAAPTAVDDPSRPADQEISISVNGQNQGAITGCDKKFVANAGVSISWTPAQQSFKPGSVLRVHAAITGEPLPDARVRVGVYAAVPLDQYVFPPRPAHLAAVESHGDIGGGKTLGTLSATGQLTQVVRPRHGLAFASETTEPGELDVYVNGKLFQTTRSWVYTESGDMGTPRTLKELGLKAGQPVTVTVVPDRYTGNTWQVDIIDTATN